MTAMARTSSPQLVETGDSSAAPVVFFNGQYFLLTQPEFTEPGAEDKLELAPAGEHPVRRQHQRQILRDRQRELDAADQSNTTNQCERLIIGRLLTGAHRTYGAAKACCLIQEGIWHPGESNPDYYEATKALTAAWRHIATILG